jgi:nucleoid-associated protein EbfC
MCYSGNKLDIQKLMKQFQNVQKDMEQAKKNLDVQSFEGVAGGGMVKVVLSGAGALTGVTFDPVIFEESEKEILIGDLLMAAHGEAKRKLEEATVSSMSKVTQGQGLPPMFGG